MFADEPFKNCCWGEISVKHLIYKSKQFVRFCLSKKKKICFLIDDDYFAKQLPLSHN